MKIFRKSFGQREDELSLQAAVTCALDGSGYGVGAMEALKSSQEKSIDMIARLIDALPLTASDIEMILGYGFEVEK